MSGRRLDQQRGDRRFGAFGRDRPSASPGRVRDERFLRVAIDVKGPTTADRKGCGADYVHRLDGRSYSCSILRALRDDEVRARKRSVFFANGIEAVWREDHHQPRRVQHGLQ